MNLSLSRIDFQRVRTIIVLPALFFAVLALSTDAIRLIPALSMVLISMATGVCVAFTPNMARCFIKGIPLDSEAVVCLGIWVAWADYVYRPAVALAYRLFPGMKWLIDSDFNSLGLYLALYAATAHLAAPAVVAGRIPSRKAATIGVIAGCGMLGAMTVGYWPEVMRLFERPEPVVPSFFRTEPRDRDAAPSHLIWRAAPRSPYGVTHA